MNYPSIRIEGAILSPDILDRIEELPGQKPADFGLASSARVKDEIARAWADAQDYWRIFQRKLEALKPYSPATTETRQQWVVPLLGLLGYQLEYQGRGVELNGKNYAISHRVANRAHIPVHVVGFLELAGLDRKPDRSNMRMSAHAIVQEFINLNEQLYGLVTNGRLLRLLRDSSRLIKLSYLEFDLDRIFSDGLFTDFAVLYRILHASRMPLTAETDAESFIERYHQDAIEQGTRIRDGLRQAVTETLELLGTGFLAHKDNHHLRELIASAKLTPTEYFNYLLRLIYRELFLNVVEERGLVFPRGTPASAVQVYFRGYSMQRLRRMAVTRGLRNERHCDAWLSLLSTFQIFERPDMARMLHATAFGGQLFSPDSLGPLRVSRISNAVFFSALDRLCSFYDTQSQQRLPVNFGALATEELGSVYESLLELHPVVETSPTQRFGFKQAAGHERKTSGSYYTPTSLVDALLDGALTPALDSRVNDFKALGYPSADVALLATTVCDPACGSGHFLIAAAQRIARRLALVRAGDNEPAPDQLRHALRQVIGHCIYGVDLNAMSVELCRVALWLESVEPGKPLSFLDHHIRIGNSLIGATPDLLAKGVTDAAFAAIEGDDSKACSLLKKINKQERNGIGPLFAEEDAESQIRIQQAAASLEALPDDRPEDVQRKEAAFRSHERTAEYCRKKLLADTWCCAFFIPKRMRHSERGEQAVGITQRHLIDIAADKPLEGGLASEIAQLTREHSFFHWYLAFPEVFANGGFDVMLGNPPWDTLSPDQREFFGQWVPGLRSMEPEVQRESIDRLLSDKSIEALWASHCRTLFALVHFLKRSGVFTLYAAGNLGKGDFNIYRMFVECALRKLKTNGVACQVVPAGLYGGANASELRKFLLDQNRLLFLIGCENKGAVFFPGVHPQTWFALYGAQRGGRTGRFRVAFGVDSVQKAQHVLSETMEIDADATRQLAPETYALSDIRSTAELDTARKMYAACPAFGDATLGAALRHYSAELHMGSNRELFTTDPTGLPVIEGRMIDRYDHRAKSYRGGHGNSAQWTERPFGDAAKAVIPQWRIMRESIPSKLGNRCDLFRVGFGDVANPRNERSLTAALIPPGVICGHTVPTFTFESQYEWMYLPWLAVANTFTMDALVRRKLSSPHMTYTVLDSLPFPRPTTLSDTFVQLVAPTVLKLTCTTIEMTPFWNRMAEHGLVKAVSSGSVPSQALLTIAERAEACARLEAIVAIQVFGLSRKELADLMDTFDVLRRREIAACGEFVSKRVTLREYDDATL